jgi:hypothetical protein
MDDGFARLLARRHGGVEEVAVDRAAAGEERLGREDDLAGAHIPQTERRHVEAGF